MTEPTPAEISRCLVYCRLRATKPGELSEAGVFPLLTLSGGNVSVHDEKTYMFDGSFGGDSHQSELFEKIGRAAIDHAMNGFCSAILSYGQTGSGKTFSMLGKVNDENLQGLIPRCAHYLFAQMAAKAEQLEFQIECQFAQIYRDHLGDLMSESGNDRVEIHWDAPTGVTLPGCSTHQLHTKEEFMELFETGFKRRVTVATAMNPESSRGHAALVVWISSKSTVPGNIEQKKGKITFIDLAGYERFSKTGISNSDPVRKDEAKTINASLLSLGHVVTALSNNEKHIPWRNSKLTRMLQDSIGGRSRTSILLTVGPSSDHLFETTNTLQFGQRAMAVKVQAKMKIIVDWEKHAKKLEIILEEKNRRIEELSQQLATCAASESELILRQQRDIDALRDKHAEEVAKLEEEGADETRLQTLRLQQNVEAELLFTQQAEERVYEEEQMERQEEEENNNNNINESFANNNKNNNDDDDNNDKRNQSEARGASVENNNSAMSPNQNNQQGAVSNSISDEELKAKDDLINDLKRQVRLFKMKLLVPEKYRGTSEEIEHEVLTSRRGRSESLSAFASNNNNNSNNNKSGEFSQNNNNNNNHSQSRTDLAGGSQEEVIPKSEYETMRKLLENEIDNRDQLLAQQLDLRSFASQVVAHTSPNDNKSNDQDQPIKKPEDSKDENQVGLYIASLQRRITDLTDRMKHQQNHHHQQPESSQQEQQQQQNQIQQVQEEDPNKISLEEATTILKESQMALLNSLQQVILDAKQSFSSSSLEFTSSILKEHCDLSHKLTNQAQFLENELETAKMEMEMALEGQNESLMQAIESARDEALASYKIEKLTWEEDTEDRINKAVQVALVKEKSNFEDSVLLLQGENAKLKNDTRNQQGEVQKLRLALAEAETRHEELMNSTQKYKQEREIQDEQQKKKKELQDKEGQEQDQAKKTIVIAAPPSTTPAVPTATTIVANTTTTKGHADPNQSQNNSNNTQTKQQQQQSILDDLDSVLMPVLKNKNQLLDDITEVLASATINGGGGEYDQDFDHIPEIPLVSGRVGTNFSSVVGTGGGGALADPHASLSNFVSMIQAQKQLQLQQRFLQQTQHIQNLDDSTNFDDMASARPTSSAFAAPPSSSSNNNKIPSLNLGGLHTGAGLNNNNINIPLLSPGPSVSVRNPSNSLISARIGGAGSTAASTSLPANLPHVMMRIIKRLRESSSEAETKWMRCVVALSKISKNISALMSNNAPSSPVVPQKGKPAQPASAASSTASEIVARSAADIMNLINAALHNTNNNDDSLSNSSNGQSNKSGRTKTMSEAEQARRALLNRSKNNNGETLMQSVVAGETGMAEQQALQSVILSQKEELARTDEEVISLAVEVARAKLQLRFERQLLIALGEDNDDELKEDVAQLDEISSKQRQEFAAESDSKRKDRKEELSFYRLKSVMLEKELRHKLGELARANQGAGSGGSSSGAAGGNTISHTNFASATKLTKQVELEQIQREIHQASASIVTDMDLITSCREAEIRVLSARLEACERELSSIKKDKTFTKDNKQNLNSSGSNQTGSSSSPSGVIASAESVFYHILRNLRKENSILHSVIRERGLHLRKYALTLMRHQLLPPSTDVAKLAGDVHSELRLAFAERDEEIFLKEQALTMRSTQVIVLEESLAALIDQLHKSNLVPCRPNSRFAAELERAKDEISNKLGVKNSSREELKSKIERIKTELEKVENKISQNRADTGMETGRSMQSGLGDRGPVTTTAHAAQSSANDALLVLRLQKDHLTHTKNISEVQLGALESEISILKQSLMSASSTVGIEAAIETRDAEENASVLSRIFKSFGGGK